MTTKNPGPALDFEHFDPDAELKAINELPESVRPDFIIVEGDLVTRFPDGQIIRTPLNVSYSTLKPIIEASDDPNEQLEKLHDLLGRDAENAIVRSQGLFSVTAVADKYFNTWERVRGVTMGESKSSSN